MDSEMEWEGTLRAVQEGTKLLILKNLALGFSKPPSYVNQAFVRQRAGIGENCGDLTCIAERIRDGLMHFPVTIRKRWNLWMIQGFGFGLR